MGLLSRRQILLLPLLFATAAAYIIAFLLRFDFTVPPSQQWLFIAGFCVFVPVKTIIYWFFRLHSLRWRLVGLFDLRRIGLASAVASAIAAACTFLLIGREFPLSIYVLEAELGFL